MSRQSNSYRREPSRPSNGPHAQYTPGQIRWLRPKDECSSDSAPNMPADCYDHPVVLLSIEHSKANLFIITSFGGRSLEDRHGTNPEVRKQHFPIHPSPSNPLLGDNVLKMDGTPFKNDSWVKFGTVRTSSLQNLCQRRRRKLTAQSFTLLQKCAAQRVVATLQIPSSISTPHGYIQPINYESSLWEQEELATIRTPLLSSHRTHHTSHNCVENAVRANPLPLRTNYANHNELHNSATSYATPRPARHFYGTIQPSRDIDVERGDVFRPLTHPHGTPRPSHHRSNRPIGKQRTPSTGTIWSNPFLLDAFKAIVGIALCVALAYGAFVGGKHVAFSLWSWIRNLAGDVKQWIGETMQAISRKFSSRMGMKLGAFMNMLI